MRMGRRWWETSAAYSRRMDNIYWMKVAEVRADMIARGEDPDEPGEPGPDGIRGPRGPRGPEGVVIE